MDSRETRTVTVCFLGTVALWFSSDFCAIPGFLTFQIPLTNTLLIPLFFQSLVCIIVAGNCKVTADSIHFLKFSGHTASSGEPPKYNTLPFRGHIERRKNHVVGLLLSQGINSGGRGRAVAPSGCVCVCECNGSWRRGHSEVTTLSPSPAHLHSPSHTAAPGPGHQWSQSGEAHVKSVGHSS